MSGDCNGRSAGRHPVCGGRTAPTGAASGAGIDLVLEMPGGRRWAIEIKRSLAPKLDKGFHHAREDLGPERSFLVYPGEQRYPRGEGVEVIGLVELASLLVTASMRPPGTRRAESD